MRILIALAVLLTLALLASSKRWWAWRRAPIGAMLTTGGWLMVGLGLLLGPDAVGLVNEQHIQVLRPLVLFCLGWIGMMVGLQLRRDLPALLPKGSLSLSGRDYLVSMFVIGLTATAILFATQTRLIIGSSLLTMLSDNQSPQPDAGRHLIDMLVIALLLGTTAVGWSAEVRSIGGTEPAGRASGNLLRAAAGLGAVWAVATYGVLFMTLSHGAAADQRDWLAVGWGVPLGLAISVAIALVIGLLAWWLVRHEANTDSQFLVVLLGLVAMAAGAAATLGYSPLWVGCLCGLIVVNLPGAALNRMKRVLIDAEQPVAMVLMLIAGVLAKPTMRWECWVLVLTLAGARWLVKQGIIRRKLLWWTPVSGKTGAVAVGPLRQAPLAIALATGYVVSGHAETTGTLIGGGELLMVVIAVGVLCEVAAGMNVMRNSQPDEAASDSDATGRPWGEGSGA